MATVLEPANAVPADVSAGTPSTLRQWACFPAGDASQARFASPQTYRLLVETAGGRLGVATIALRSAPDASLASALAAVLDRPALTTATLERVQGEFEDASGHGITLADIDLDHDDPLALTCAVQRALTVAAVLAGKGTTPTALSRLREEIASRTRDEWEGMRSRFIARLNPDAVAHARANGGLTPSRYGEFAQTTPEQRRNRAQALDLFPLLHPLLAGTGYDNVRHAIDAGQPLIDALAAAWRAPKALVRGLRGVGPGDLGALAARPDQLAILMGDIPPDWWPRNPEAWRRCSTAIDAILHATRRRPAAPINRLWVKAAARNDWSTSAISRDDMMRAAEEIDEFLSLLRRAVAWALGGRQGARVLDRMVAFQFGIGITRLIETAARFGANYRRAVAAMSEETEMWNGMRWPAIGAEARQHGSLRIEALLTPQALAEEGARMENCVACYAETCLQGRSQIWSIRSAEGSIATLETRIATSAGRPMVRQVQLKGPNNQGASGDALAAARDLVNDINAHPEDVGIYLAWRQEVACHPIELRRREALMRPIAAALERTLTGLWSWQRLTAADFDEATADPCPAAAPAAGNE